jgi:asparagine synthase (glutamine-hydrolysing)
MSDHHAPGLLVLVNGGERSPVDLAATLSTVGLDPVSIVTADGYALVTWGLAFGRPTRDKPLLLSLTNCRHGGRVDEADLARWLADGSMDKVSAMLPPFGAVGLAPGGIRVVSDHTGVRQLYRANGAGWSGFSTSARALAALVGAGLDEEGLLLQSQLGWQLSERTLFRGVTKVPAGEVLRVRNGQIQAEYAPQQAPVPISLDQGVQVAATVLRGFVERFLDERPDALLQLTGGQDSRLVLSAVPRARRRDLQAMTLAVPGSSDTSIATALAARYGMRHTIEPLAGLSQLSPGDSYTLACRLASTHDCMADPLARAAIFWAEQSLPQGARLSGIGGEIARGFYYSGWVRAKAVSRERAEQLARWRLFTNEAVEIESLAEPYAGRARLVALDLAVQAITAGGHEWYAATDNLYYRHRMQRWLGVCESAVALARAIINPMLDDRFLSVSLGLAPWDKQNARFLGRLQVALDDELASIPLDGRPAPNAYAYPGPLEVLNQHAAMARRVARKVRQRITRAKKPAAGTTVLAGKITEHLRANPAVIDPALRSGVFDQAWLDSVCSGVSQPAPSSLALLINVIVASGGADEALRGA